MLRRDSENLLCFLKEPLCMSLEIEPTDALRFNPTSLELKVSWPAFGVKGGPAAGTGTLRNAS